MNAWILLAGVSLSFITTDTNNLLFKFSSFWLNWTFNSMLVVKFWTMRHSGVSILCLRVSRLREDFCLSQKDKTQFDFHLFYKEASETGFDCMWQQINTRNFVKKQVFARLATVILNVSLNTEHVTETVVRGPKYLMLLFYRANITFLMWKTEKNLTSSRQEVYVLNFLGIKSIFIH